MEHKMNIKFFNAKWCGPCKQMKPHIDELISEGYNIQLIDVDEQPELAQEYNVRGVPTLVVNGNSLVGYRDKNQIKEAVGA
jgi:thioredoxin 1